MPFWLTSLGLLCAQPCLLIGPDFWGLMHKQWRMCKAGKLQSPINIDPEKLVFDPGLGKLLVSGQQLDASLWNTGQFPLLTVNASGGGNGGGDPKEEAKAGKQHSAAAAGGSHHSVTFSGGPAFPYTYQFQQMLFHFGDIRKGERGSEHTIDRVRYPAEVQLLAFNSDLYENFTQAQSQPKGLLAIGLIVDIGNKTNPELKRLSHAAPSIKHRNQMVRVQHFQPAALLPGTEHFVSYEGSLTFPGCFETVTWVLYNSPIYISTEHLAIWAELVQSEKPALDKDKTGQQHQQQQQRGETAPPVPLTSNYRPLKANNGRLVRTNINVKLKSPGPAENGGGNCPSNVYVDMGYQSNPKRAEASSSLSPSLSASRKQHRQHSKGIGSSHEQYKYQLGGISTGGG